MAFKVNIEDQRYDTAIMELGKRIENLNDIVAQYQKIHNEADDCYHSEKTEQLKQAIQNNINNINQSIGAAKAQMEEYTKIRDNAKTTNEAISQIVNDAAQAAQNIFQ